MEKEACYAILLFVLISLIISIAFKEEIKKNTKKHILAGMFMFFAAIIYMMVIVLTL
jgi:hypothetical protein|tara:strand:- start:873 stop:1043 length:171 start_codon:yes stop_codon:yes gene_type:complete